jgi:hypothetical protein
VPTLPKVEPPPIIRFQSLSLPLAIKVFFRVIKGRCPSGRNPVARELKKQSKNMTHKLLSQAPDRIRQETIEAI